METDHLSHIDDPWTSNHAAVTLNPSAQVAIRHAVVKMLGEKPMTDDELKHAYRARAEREGWPLTTDMHNIARRRSELTHKFNVIEPSGEHGVSDRGKTATKWRLKFEPDTCHIIAGLPPEKSS